MQGLHDTAAFDEFCRAQRKALSSIASQADRAVQVGDVVATAWEMACLIQTRTGAEIDFRNRDCQDTILRYTHFELVGRAEKHTKYAIRLDQAPSWSDDDCHPLMRHLSGPESDDPLNQLIARETPQADGFIANPHQSLACAYVHLLESCRGRMPAMAHFLRISVSHTYRCCARARDLAERQCTIPMHMQDLAFQPRPWRLFKRCRIPEQLMLNFGEDLLDVIKPASS